MAKPHPESLEFSPVVSSSVTALPPSRQCLLHPAPSILYFSVRLSAIIIWCGVLWYDLPGRPSLEDLPQIVVSNLLPLATACPRGRIHRPRAGSTHLLMFSAVFDHLLIKSDPFLICNLILLPTFFPRLFLYRQIQIIEPRPICPSRNLFAFPLPLP